MITITYLKGLSRQMALTAIGISRICFQIIGIGIKLLERARQSKCTGSKATLTALRVQEKISKGKCIDNS